jgi:tetratricopeptide (TPR) repeat protein
MQCPSCRTENREGCRFCAKCGASLALACPACGFVNEPGDEFCGGCGAHLAGEPTLGNAAAATPDRPAADGAERRQVTILFADLSGFTKLTSARDPEETHRLMGRFFEAVAGMRVTDDYDEALSVLAHAEAASLNHGLDRERSEVHYYRGNLYFPLGNIAGRLE